MSVPDLLAASRAAHVRYRTLHDASKNTATAEMRAAVAEAYDTRLAAHALDPSHVDPAWAIDVFTDQPVSSDDLMAFYGSYLAR